MSEDILYQKQKLNIFEDLDCTDEIFNETLIIIEDGCLLISGKNLKQWGLTSPNRIQNTSLPTEVLRETSYNVTDLNTYINKNKSQLVDDQNRHLKKL